MKSFLINLRLIPVLSACFLMLASFSCNKDEDDDNNNNNNNGGMWNPDWMIGTWEGTTPVSISPWGGTKIKIVFESYSLVEHDTLPSGSRKAYGYSGTFTWDVEGDAPWSKQFFASNYPIPDFNVILWDCLLTTSGQTMNNISLRVGDDEQTDPFHTVNLDCGSIIDATGNAPTSLDFYGDVEITYGDVFEEALYPPTDGSMIRLTKK